MFQNILRQLANTCKMIQMSNVADIPRTTWRCLPFSVVVNPPLIFLQVFLMLLIPPCHFVCDFRWFFFPSISAKQVSTRERTFAQRDNVFSFRMNFSFFPYVFLWKSLFYFRFYKRCLANMYHCGDRKNCFVVTFSTVLMRHFLSANHQQVSAEYGDIPFPGG